MAQGFFYDCIILDKFSFLFQLLDIHTKEHVTKSAIFVGKTTIFCKMCARGYSDRQQFNNHLGQHVPKDQVEFCKLRDPQEETVNYQDLL